jgi:hypothetical protein
MTGLDFPYFPLWKDGLVPPVDPSDLKIAWKRGQELRAQYGSEPTVVSHDLRGTCSPEADVIAVWYRASMLGLLAERVGLLPPEMPSEVRDVVFNVVAKFPMKHMESGVQYHGSPVDVEGFVKQIEHELGVGQRSSYQGTICHWLASYSSASCSTS